MTAIPTLVAHRGYMAHYPENSLKAMTTALKSGACLLEFDIQMAADGQFVLLHDADFRRTGDNPARVFDLTSKQIQSISVHEPQRFGTKFKPTRVPLLTEVLDLLNPCPKASALVEIKTESLDHWGVGKVMAQLVACLQPYRPQCQIISYSSAALEYARRLGDWPIGWVIRHFDRSHQQQAEQLQPDLLICNYQKIGETVPLWAGSWRWMVYDITDPELALSWAQRGADLIETADIGAMLSHPKLAQGACKHGL